MVICCQHTCFDNQHWKQMQDLPSGPRHLHSTTAFATTLLLQLLLQLLLDKTRQLRPTTYSIQLPSCCVLKLPWQHTMRLWCCQVPK